MKRYIFGTIAILTISGLTGCAQKMNVEDRDFLASTRAAAEKAKNDAEAAARDAQVASEKAALAASAAAAASQKADRVLQASQNK